MEKDKNKEKEPLTADANGNTAEDDDFFDIDGSTWIYRGQVDGKFVYQKFAERELLPLIKLSSTRALSLTYKEWREMVTGKQWSELMQEASEVVGQMGEGERNETVTNGIE